MPNAEKGSFAPSPDKIEMMEKIDNEMMKKSMKFHQRIASNDF